MLINIFLSSVIFIHKSIKSIKYKDIDVDIDVDVDGKI